MDKTDDAYLICWIWRLEETDSNDMQSHNLSIWTW